MKSKKALRTILINCKDLLVDENYNVVQLESLIKIILQDLKRLEELEKVIDILKLVIELPLEDDIDYVDSKGNNLYKLRIKRLLGEEAYKKVKEVLGNAE